MSVEWTLFDSLQREITFEGDTRGESSGVYDGAFKQNMTEANSIAFENSLRNLLTQEKFVAQLRVQSRSAARNQSQH